MKGWTNEDVELSRVQKAHPKWAKAAREHGEIILTVKRGSLSIDVKAEDDTVKRLSDPALTEYLGVRYDMANEELQEFEHRP